MISKRLLPGILLAAVMGTGVAAVTAVASAASGTPDFSGTWMLNAERSDFAGETPPMSKMQKVEQAGIDLTVTIDEIGERGTVHGVARYTTDGRDVVNDVLGNQLTSSIGWEGAIMIMRTWGKFGSADIMLIDRWSLSPDGKTLTIAREFQGHGQVADQTLVFDRK
jgi:hypothetical protein